MFYLLFKALDLSHLQSFNYAPNSPETLPYALLLQVWGNLTSDFYEKCQREDQTDEKTALIAS